MIKKNLLVFCFIDIFLPRIQSFQLKQWRFYISKFVFPIKFHQLQFCHFFFLTCMYWLEGQNSSRQAGSSILHLLVHSPNVQYLEPGQGEVGSPKLHLDSHVHPSTWVITCCFPVCSVTGTWTWSDKDRTLARHSDLGFWYPERWVKHLLLHSFVSSQLLATNTVLHCCQLAYFDGEKNIVNPCSALDWYSSFHLASNFWWIRIIIRKKAYPTLIISLQSGSSLQMFCFLL